MTITPQQAMKLNDGNRKEIRELEETIDKVLSEEFGKDRSSVFVNTKYLDGRVRTEIKRMYGEAGWNVRFHSDQRDGDYAEFSPKKGYGGKQ